MGGSEVTRYYISTTSLVAESSLTEYMKPRLAQTRQYMKQKILGRVAGVIFVVGLSSAMAADNPCQEAQDILGLSLTPATIPGSKATPALVITDIIPLSQGARIGLVNGDIIEQVNSWQARDCQSYSRAVQDARDEQKAILLLVTRKGKRQPLAFEPELWQRKQEEQQEKEAVANLQTMLSAPLPPNLKHTTDRVGTQALTVLRTVEAVAMLTDRSNKYEQAVANAKAQLAALSRASQGEAEQRVVAGANVLLGYYLTAQDIRHYKQDFVSSDRKDLRKGRAATVVTPEVPYFLKSPVPGWIDKYPFLRASIHESPQVANFIEQPGSWDPDMAVKLLWDKAKEETEQFARWLNGGKSDQRSAIHQGSHEAEKWRNGEPGRDRERRGGDSVSVFLSSSLPVAVSPLHFVRTATTASISWLAPHLGMRLPLSCPLRRRRV